MQSVAEVIARQLRSSGVEAFFLVTGADQTLWIAMHDNGIRLVNCRSEQGATYIADGYARFSGRPGFVYGQFGPGVANVAASLADAYWASSPVVSLTSSVRTQTVGLAEYQELDQLGLHGSLVKWQRSIPRADRAAEYVRAAIRAATGPIPGPTHLELPADMIVAEVEDVPVYAEADFGRVPSPLRVAPPPGAVGALVDDLLAAQRPVILAGGGVVRSQAWDELADVAAQLAIPVATSVAGKGSIAEDDPHAIGVVGRYSRHVANELLREADYVLAVGSRLGPLTTDSYHALAPGTRIGHVDLDPSALGQAFAESVGVLGDAQLVLAEVATQLRERRCAQPFADWLGSAQRRTADWWQAVRSTQSATSDVLHPAEAVLAMSEVMGADDVLVADTGYMSAWASAVYSMRKPGRNFLRAAGSLGWALPASIGAAVAAKGSVPVVGLTGDGGAGYNIMVLETAQREGVPVVVVVFNNGKLAYEYHAQKLTHQRVLSHINDFSPISYADVATALGATGVRVRDRSAVADALGEARRASGPVLLEVMIDPEVPAPVTSYEKVLARQI